MGMEIIHEDRDIIVIDKAAGLLTVGTGQDAGRTAHAALMDYVRKGNPKSPHRVFVVHRLDRDTSGLLVFARSEAAKFTLQDNWEQVEKTYLAVVEGSPRKDEDTLSSHLTENAAGFVYSTRKPGEGKLSLTRYRILEKRGGRTLLEIGLLTGRKNQIRVQLADIGCPIVGDAKYGKADRKSKRLALHARTLAFRHPYDGRCMVFEARPPESFRALLDSPSPPPPSSGSDRGSGSEPGKGRPRREPGARKQNPSRPS